MIFLDISKFREKTDYNQSCHALSLSYPFLCAILNLVNIVLCQTMCHLRGAGGASSLKVNISFIMCKQSRALFHSFDNRALLHFLWRPFLTWVCVCGVMYVFSGTCYSLPWVFKLIAMSIVKTVTSILYLIWYSLSLRWILLVKIAF